MSYTRCGLDHQILECLRTHGPLNTQDLTSKAGGSRSAVRTQLLILTAVGEVYRGGLFTYYWSLPKDSAACDEIAGNQTHMPGPARTQEQQEARKRSYQIIHESLLQLLSQGPNRLEDVATACGISKSCTRKHLLLLQKDGAVICAGPAQGPHFWALPDQKTEAGQRAAAACTANFMRRLK